MLLLLLIISTPLFIGAHALSLQEYSYYPALQEHSAPVPLLDPLEQDIPTRQTSLYSNIGSPSIITRASLPYTISSPGRYILVEAGSYSPAASGTAITINASDVNLDLLSFNLVQANGVASVNGVVVASGLSNVTIQNGVVRDFSGVGISVGSGCSRVFVNNVTFYDCGNRGLELVGTANSPIQVGALTNCNFVSSSTLSTADNVLTISNCSDFEVAHCNLHNNGSTGASGALAMVNMTNNLRCKFTDLEVHNNIGNTDLRCYDLKQSSYCKFIRCHGNTNLAWGASSAMYGVLLEGSSTSTANLFCECVMANLTGTIVDGFLSSTNCDDNAFMLCKSLNNQANSTTGVVHGFRCITNNRNIYVECLAAHNTAPSSTVASPLYGAYGFKLDTTTGTYLRKCVANDQTAASRAVGYFFISDNQITIEENAASRNTTFGFDAANVTFNNQAFIKNFALKNNTAGGSGSDQYNGFGANAANDGFTASNFGTNTGGITGQPGPISWVNLGIG